MEPAQQVQDCIVVGGGPAGLTAALYLARFLRTVTVFDAGQGRSRMIPMTHNLGGFPNGISGRDLLERMHRHAVMHGAMVKTATVLSVKADGNGYRVDTHDGFEIARSVIFAMGVFNHRPQLSAEKHDAGLARGLIRYCPVCDGFEARGKRIAVLGKGDHAFDEARFIRHYASSVTLIAPKGEQAVAMDGIHVPDAPMRNLAVTSDEVIVTLEGGKIIRFDTLYVALGTTANSGLAAALGAGLDPEGFVVVDAKQKTTVTRVYAIGDVVKGLDQIATAMGQGAAAATDIHNDLRLAWPMPVAESP